MCIQRINAEAVVQNDCISCKEKVLCQNNAPTIGGMHRSAHSGMKIRTCMRCARLSVKDSPMAEVRSGFTGYRNGEGFVPESICTDLLEDGFRLFGFPKGTRKVGLAELDILVLDLQFGRWKLLGFNIHKGLTLLHSSVLHPK